MFYVHPIFWVICSGKTCGKTYVDLSNIFLFYYFLFAMYMVVEELACFYLWQLCICEPIWKQRTHIIENEYICQLNISFWHINAYHGVRSSVAEYWAPACFLCTAYCEVQWLESNNKANLLSLQQLQYFITQIMNTVLLPGLWSKKQTSEPRGVQRCTSIKGDKDFVRVGFCVN